MASLWPLLCRTHLLSTFLSWMCCIVAVQAAASTPPGLNCTHDNQCSNGGWCMKSAIEGAVCQCKPGWSGDFCQDLAPLPCLSHPCKNGATCQNLLQDFVCHCDVYWTGAHCEVFKGLPDSPPISTSCSSSDYQCRDGSCVVGQSLCDGVIDCSDGSDELCSSVQPNSQCAVWEFECADQTCIPRYKWCDLFRDCVQGEDELNCVPVFQEGPASPARPMPGPSGSSKLVIITCSVLMAVVVVTLLVYFRRVRSTQRRFYSPVSWTLNRHGDGISMPYHVSQHADFCHHLPPHRCPRPSAIHGLVGYPLAPDELNSVSDEPDVLLTALEVTTGGTGGDYSGRGLPKDYSADGDDVPPTYSDVIKSDEEARQLNGDETPPPSYEDL